MLCLGCAAKLLTDGWIQFLTFLVSYYIWWLTKYFKQFDIYCIAGSTSLKEETGQVRLLWHICVHVHMCMFLSTFESINWFCRTWCEPMSLETPLLQFPTVSNNSMLAVQTNEVAARLVTHHLHPEWYAVIYLRKICVFVVVIFLSVECKITKYEHFFVCLVWWWLLLNHIATHYVCNIVWKLANTYIMTVQNMGIINMSDTREYGLSNKTFTKVKQNK